ncbi:MAG: TrkA family potassium uptake protein [Lentisphaeria bacterium]
MNTKTVVIGLGLFGREIATALSKRNHSVLAVDRSPNLVEEIKEEVDEALVLDTTDERALYDAKVNEMNTAVCAIGAQHIENSILTTALLHQIGVPEIVVRASDDLHGRILRQVGATKVINPEEEMGWRLANQIASPGLREVLRLAPDVCLAEIPLPAGFIGETPESLNVRRKFGVTVVGVQRRTEAGAVAESKAAADIKSEAGFQGAKRLILDIVPDSPFEEGDVLIVVGHEDKVKKLSALA